MATTANTVRDLREMEEALRAHEANLRLSMTRVFAEGRAAGKPECSDDRVKAKVRGLQLNTQVPEYDATKANLLHIVRKRKAAERRLFAGNWPPRDPLAIQAMFVTLGRDYDDLVGTGYVGDQEDCGERIGPLSVAWGKMLDALQAMTPDTPERATAIYRAWQDDDESGCGHEWRPEQVEAAKRLAMPNTERPR